MSSLLSQAEKDALSAVIVNVAETFERPITIYKEAQQTVISSDPNYNRFNAADQNAGNTVIPIRYSFPARILYGKKSSNPYMEPYLSKVDGKGQLKIRTPDEFVRIKIGPSGNAIMADSKRIEFDGTLFEVDSVVRPHGLFDVQYYTYYLKPLE